jgi:hypothetical protein
MTEFSAEQMRRAALRMYEESCPHVFQPEIPDTYAMSLR